MMRSGILAVALAAGLALPAAAPAQSPAQLRPAYTAALGLASFDSAWSRINATHYDTLFHGIDWAAVRAELRPSAMAAANADELRGVIRAMLARLGESHYTLIPAEVADAVTTDSTAGGSPGDLGLELRLVEGEFTVWRVAPDGPAAAAGIGAGWVVQSIGSWSPAEGNPLIQKLHGMEQRRALTQFQFSANAQTDGPAGSRVQLQLRDGAGRTRVVSLERRPRPGESVRFGHMPAFIANLEHERIGQADGCIGLIRFNVWMVPLMSAFDQAIDELRNCRGIILDLRGNPGGVAGMVMGVSGHFLGERTSLGTMRSRGSELSFVANPRRVDTAARPVEPFAGPLAILVDDMSASTSEIFAGGMQAIGRARIFGEPTAGQALPAALVRLPDGDVLMHVVADFTAAGGARIEGRGVIPDVRVALRRADLLAGRDAAREAALAWIRHHAAMR